MEASLRELLVNGSSHMGIDLPAEAVSRFEVLLSLLQTWGKRINLTTRLEAREVVIHHFLDSLAGAPLIAECPGARLVDLGSGAGFPCFPLKFALPRLRVTMIESVRKKVSFCKEVIRATGSTGIEALCGRSEELGRDPRHREAYEWAVSRALGSCAEVMKLALPFLAPGGRLVLYKGVPGARELEELEAACGKLDVTWSIREVAVPYLEARRSLVVLTRARS